MIDDLTEAMLEAFMLQQTEIMTATHPSTGWRNAGQQAKHNAAKGIIKYILQRDENVCREFRRVAELLLKTAPLHNVAITTNDGGVKAVWPAPPSHPSRPEPFYWLDEESDFNIDPFGFGS